MSFVSVWALELFLSLADYVLQVVLAHDARTVQSALMSGGQGPAGTADHKVTAGSP